MMEPSSKITWQSFSAAPHRLFFWSGAIYSVWVVALWTMQQISLYTAWLEPMVWSIPFSQAHAFMMVYAVFAFYLFAFLLTTFPRWLGGSPIPRKVYLGLWVLFNTGGHAFWIGLWAGKGMVLVGAGLVAMGYLGIFFALGAVARRAQRPWPHEGVMLFAIAMAVVGIVLFMLATARGIPLGYYAIRWLGVYGYLLLLVLTVMFRMVPFFTSAATEGMELRRSEYGVAWFAALVALRTITGLAGKHEWAWVFDGGLAVVLLREMILWRFWRANFQPLLTVLYYSLAWFLIAFLLSAGESLYMFITGWGALPFGNASLHAMTVGGFGTLILGISTRVSLGHSGRGLVATPVIHTLFWAFQLVPLARIVPEVLGFWWPQWTIHGFWSGMGWVLVFGLWFLFLAPVLMAPRSDGRPG